MPVQGSQSGYQMGLLLLLLLGRLHFPIVAPALQALQMEAYERFKHDYEDVPVVSPTDDRLPRRLIIIIYKMRQSMLPFRWFSSLCGGGSPKQLPPPGLPQRALPPSRLLDSSAPDERRLQLASCDSDLLPSTRAMPRHSFKFQVMSLSVLGQSI